MKGKSKGGFKKEEMKEEKVPGCILSTNEGVRLVIEAKPNSKISKIV